MELKTYQKIRIELFRLMNQANSCSLCREGLKPLPAYKYMKELFMINALEKQKTYRGKIISTFKTDDNYGKLLNENNPDPFRIYGDNDNRVHFADMFILCPTQYAFHLNRFFSNVFKEDVVALVKKIIVECNDTKARTIIDKFQKRLLHYYETKNIFFWYYLVYFTIEGDIWDGEKEALQPSLDSLLISNSIESYDDVLGVLNIGLVHGFRSNISKRESYASIINSSRTNPILLYEHGIYLLLSGNYENYMNGLLFLYEALSAGATIAAFDIGFAIYKYGPMTKERFEKKVASLKPQSNGLFSYSTLSWDEDEEYFSRMLISLDYFEYGEEHGHYICTNAIANCLRDILDYEEKGTDDQVPLRKEAVNSAKEKIFTHYSFTLKDTDANRLKAELYKRASDNGNLNGTVNYSYYRIKEIKREIAELNSSNSIDQKDNKKKISNLRKMSKEVLKDLYYALSTGLLSEAALVAVSFIDFCANTMILDSNKNALAFFDICKSKEQMVQMKREYLYLGTKNPVVTVNQIECVEKYNELIRNLQ